MFYLLSALSMRLYHPEVLVNAALSNWKESTASSERDLATKLPMKIRAKVWAATGWTQSPNRAGGLSLWRSR